MSDRSEERRGDAEILRETTGWRGRTELIARGVPGVRAVRNELEVRKGELKLYDKRQDAEKTAFRELYERMVEGVRADISGPIENPKADTWQVVARGRGDGS